MVEVDWDEIFRAEKERKQDINAEPERQEADCKIFQDSYFFGSYKIYQEHSRHYQ